MLAALSLIVALRGPLHAQQPDTLIVAPDSVLPAGVSEDGGTDQGVTPRGALLRGMVLPGWGHASIGANTRGGFYVAVEASTAWMLFKTVSRLRAAKRVRNLRESELRTELAAAGLTDPATVVELLDSDPDVGGARALVGARRSQLEDWLALGIFLAFLSGVDAFVSAHLQNFPEPVAVEIRATDDRMELGVSLGVGGGG